MTLVTLMMSAIIFQASFDINIFDKVRANYNKLVSDKALCENFISEFKKANDNSAMSLAYLGSLQTIRANHIFNPVYKLNTFNEGKKSIEKAIEKEPENLEIRFVRLSVQKNAPFFLGYKSIMEEDIEFIRKNCHQITSEILRENIKAVLND